MREVPFVDTNILVYAVSSSGQEVEKTERSRSILRNGTVCLSTQVLGEFYSVVTSRKRVSPLTPAEAVAWVQLWKRHEVRAVTTAHVDLALEIAGHYRINYYDALIVSSARLAGCSILYSEDLADLQAYGGVHVQNPFRKHKA